MKDRRLPTLTTLLLWSTLLVGTLLGVQGETDVPGPSESECQPYIEKALKKLETGDTQSVEDETTEDATTHLSISDESEIVTGSDEINIDALQKAEESTQVDDIVNAEELEGSPLNEDDADSISAEKEEIEKRSIEDDNETHEVVDDLDSTSTETAENDVESKEEVGTTESIETSIEQTQEASEEKNVDGEDDAVSTEHKESIEDDSDTKTSTEKEDTDSDSKAVSAEQDKTDEDSQAASKEQEGDSQETEQQSIEETEQQNVEGSEQQSVESKEDTSTLQKSAEDDEQGTTEQVDASHEEDKTDEKTEEEASVEKDTDSTKETTEELEEEQKSQEDSKQEEETDTKEVHDADSTESAESTKHDEDSVEESKKQDEASIESTEEKETEKGASTEEISDQVSIEDSKKTSAEDTDTAESDSQEKVESVASQESVEVADATTGEQEESVEDASSETKSAESTPVEDLTWDFEIPEDLRSREHIDEIFHLNIEEAKQNSLKKATADKTLQELKRIYENAIKPLEVLYKYRDLSNRHFGDSEIFSKPLVLFMGPWSGGKSSIINYLLDNEYQQTSLRTGAEPSPAYFNLLSWGEKPEVLDGTQLAADWTFSGLQKFGQGLEERLRGVKLPSKLLEKINIVEIPGILEVRKQVSRMFPFNDACQWFIDRADIIFLVYDPSKLDVGPETEAILDQLKGREYQTRIILNKADQVKPEELMRVQGALIWNISPLMSSAQPPVMYSTSLWSRPYESGAPTRLLFAQERSFLNDLKSAIDKRIENKIASARRFAVRVRNHAKMVDCYLTTYYNHKSVFGNKKMVAEHIIEHPQNYHIYEGLSTLTNISRYDLPDPDVYRDFFRLNALYDFQQLSATCTYFRGCPINRLDIAIAYDLPELVGKYKKAIELIQSTAESTTQS